MRRAILMIVLATTLLLTGCIKEGDKSDPGLLGNLEPDYTADIEPTATYDWMKGESPVENKRIGILRSGISSTQYAISPTGIYYLQKDFSDFSNNYIWYCDHGSDTFVKLCGRADCNHDNTDCNAYVYEGSVLSFYHGYLYVMSGGMVDLKGCQLIRMKPDGSDHIQVLDFEKYVKGIDGDMVSCELITDGYCIFTPKQWVITDSSDDASEQMEGKSMGYYIYKLDGSMEQPQKVNISGMLMYNCSDVLLMLGSSDSANEGGGYFHWDVESDSKTFLTKHPGVPGYFGKNEAFYSKDGNIIRLDYETQKETVMVNTHLGGNYYLHCFPDCMILASRNDKDSKLYIYNWAFELVDTVAISYPHSGRTQHLVVAETAERIILSDYTQGAPVAYINKAELGTDNAKIHFFSFA